MGGGATKLASRSLVSNCSRENSLAMELRFASSLAAEPDCKSRLVARQETRKNNPLSEPTRRLYLTQN